VSRNPPEHPLDPDPDDRGNLMTFAVIASGHMIALTMNVN
jgi:hypothetical protein